MRTGNGFLRVLFVGFLCSSLLLLAGCGRIPITGDSSEPGTAPQDEQAENGGAIHFPEVTRKDWVTSISSLCLQVNQTYPDVTGVSEPIAEELKAILDRIGVAVTIGESAACQANLQIDLEFTPYGESVGGAGTCYFDASTEGTAVLSKSGEKDLEMELVRQFSPSKGFGITFVYSCPSKAAADYAEAWGLAIIPMIAEWWGAPGLVSALRSNNDSLRNSAGYSLSQMGAGGSQAVPVLIEMLKDVDPIARQSAARTLGLFGGSAKEAVPDLIAIVDDPDHEVKTEVIRALGYIGDTQAVPVLMDVLKEQLEAGTDQYAGYSDTSTTIQALGAMKEAAAPALPLLIEAVKSEDYSTASSALDALEAIGPAAREAVPTLIEIMELGDEASLSGWIVADTLEVITGQEFGEDAVAWRNWWEANK